MRTLTSSSSGGECRNPSFGLATKAKGVARLRAKRKEARELSQEEARESHHILPGVQESARECEGVNTHTPKAISLGEMESQWTPETSESDCRGQTSMDCGVLYINGKLLKHRMG